MAAAVLAYAVGVVLGYRELTVIGGLLILLMVAAVGWVLFPPSLTVTRQVEPGRVRRNDAALGLVDVANTGRRRAPRLQVEDRAGAQLVRLELPALRAGASFASTYRIPTARRGVFSVGPLILAQTDPFGLMARRRPFGDAATLWVHPRTHRLTGGSAGNTVEMDGPMDDTAPEGTIAFQGLRPYVVGDDLRMVHWRTTARTGTLMIKKHVDTSRPQVVVILDDRAGSYPGPDAFEEAVDVAASVVEQALRTAAPVRLDTISGALAGVVPIGVRDALDILARVELGQGGELNRAVNALTTELGGSAAILVSGDRLPDPLEHLDPLGARYRRLSALLVGADGAVARRIGRLEVCRAPGAATVLGLWQSNGAR
jgi:uncharacterized protein (DUF58 family)